MSNQLFQTFLIKFYQTAKGRELLKEEQTLLNHSLARIFGYFLVQLGQTSQQDLLKESRVSFKVLVDYNILSDQQQEFVRVDLDYLPFKRDSIDAVFLPHTLETVQDPYHLLRQVDKMILPEGSLIISGFNPYGSKILRLKFGEFKQQFKQAHFITESRLIDWLNLLGYDIKCIHYKEDKPANSIKTLLLSFLRKFGLEHRSVYVISAKKRVESQTPIGLNWRLANWLPVKKGQTVASSNSSHTQNKRYKCKQ